MISIRFNQMGHTALNGFGFQMGATRKAWPYPRRFTRFPSVVIKLFPSEEKPVTQNPSSNLPTIPKP